jgi:stage II sporulation protein D
MSATASDELLKAHAVISRSWLLHPIMNPVETHRRASLQENKHIKWYERDAHTHFDVCADDHCQRYQGITRATTAAVEKAIEATHGEVLMFEDKICDARFSKSCGGASETFENCWAPEHYPYLTKVIDNHTDPEGFELDLTFEVNAEKWIRQSPEAFCNTTDKKVLAQVLNNYDQETTDFYRWKVNYTQAELSELLARRSGIDFGEIIDLIPVKRGESGRIIELNIVGTKRSIIVGKELEIRKWLSNSHLYSSAFVVDKTDLSNGIPQHFTLTGAGWGHGVGLCQIGAAVMGEKGYPYNEILLHYFRGAELKRIY